MSAAFTRMARAIAALKQPAAIEKFLLELMTPGEVHDLGLRWELVELLVDGVSQRQIAAQLGISLCKITRGAKILKKRNGAVSAIFASRTSKAQKKSAKGKSDPAAQKKKPAPLPPKKVEKKNGTRVSGKSQNQVRRKAAKLLRP